MKKTVTFTTRQGHSFLYSPFKNQFLLIHPLIGYFFSLEKKGRGLTSLSTISGSRKKITIKGSGTFTAEEIRYQYRKYRFLKRHHYFDTSLPLNLTGKLMPLQVEQNISSTKQVIFETTEDCNLSCSYCTYSKFYINKERGKKRFNTGDARKFLDHIMKRRNKEATELIVSFYGGEPLKNFRFIRDIVSYILNQWGLTTTFRFTMTTNGLLLKKYAAFLYEHDFEISVSLDGDDKGNAYRLLKNKKPSFDLVIRNVDHIRQYYPVYFEKNFSFITVLHNRNSYTDIHSFFSEKYGKIPMVSEISTANVNLDYFTEFRNTFLVRKHRNYDDKQLRGKLFMHHPGVKDIANTVEKYSGFVFSNPAQFLTGSSLKGSRQFVPTATCMPFSLRVFLSADGTILPCEHISRIFEIGFIGNNLFNIDPADIARKYNNFFRKIKPLCDFCYLADNCKECVFNTRIETENPTCDFFMDETRFALYLSSHFSIIEDDFPLYLRITREAFHEK